MKIVMLLEREFPPDDRVEKEAISLINAGHEVHIACYTFTGRDELEDYKGIIIHRRAISQAYFKAGAACLILPFYFKFWKIYIEELFKKYSFEAIHIHDLPLSMPGYFFKKKYGVKMICDQHEYYSNWIIHTAHYNTFLGKIVNVLSNWRKYEQKYLKKADLVITVEEPLRRCYIDEVKIHPGSIILVPNTPLSSVFNLNNIREDITRKYRDDFVLFYAGGIDRLRGLDLIIEALPIIRKKIKNLKFLFAGSISKGYDPFKKAETLGVDSILEFVGWIDINDMPSYIASSNVCLFTPPANRDEINKTIATKIYQYAAMGKPIITSDAKMMKDFVINNQIGFSVVTPEELAKNVLELYYNKELYQEMVHQSLSISKSYIWENTIKKLIAFYEHK